MQDYDMILGMDWLSKYNATIDSKKEKMVFQLSEKDQFMFVGTPLKTRMPMISVMNAKKLLKKSCMRYLVSVIDASIEQKVELEDVPVVRDFLEVFPKDLLGLPPDREIEFVTTPISKAPYIMTPAELNELKTQLQELLDKKFIEPSYSS